MAALIEDLSLSSSIPLLVVPILLILLYVKTHQQKPTNLPPGPRPLPIIGNLHLIGALPHRSLRDLSITHGPLMYVQLGRIPTVVASSPETAAEILKTQDLALCDRPPVNALDKFSYGGQDIAGSNYNEAWRQAKKVAVLELFTAKRVASFAAVRKEETATLINTISAAARAGAGRVNLGEMVTCLFNNMVCREVFGRRISEEGVCGRSRYQDLTMEMIYLMGGFCVGDLFPGLEWVNVLNGRQAILDKNFKEMDGFLEEEIEAHVKRMESGEEVDDHSDFCSILLKLHKDPTPGTSNPITRTQIKGTLMDMFIGGTETSSSTLEWGMSELMRHPTSMKKAQEEVRRVAGNKGKVEESDLQHLHYLKLVIKEAFRLHSLSLIPRRCREACKINGYDIPVNTTVYVNTWAIARDPNNYDNPEEFWPERFEDSVIDYKGQHFQLLPFGSGRRMCPASALGTVGLELAFANVLYNFDWELPDGEKGVDMEERFGLTIQKKVPLVLKATPVNFV